MRSPLRSRERLKHWKGWFVEGSGGKAVGGDGLERPGLEAYVRVGMVFERDGDIRSGAVVVEALGVADALVDE